MVNYTKNNTRPCPFVKIKKIRQKSKQKNTTKKKKINNAFEFRINTLTKYFLTNNIIDKYRHKLFNTEIFMIIFSSSFLLIYSL